MPHTRSVQLRPLTLAETAELRRWSKATSARVDLVQRARALLAVAAGQSFAAAARHAGYCSRSTSPDLVTRFNALGVAVLEIAVGRGRAPTYQSAARTQILDKLRQPPDRAQDGTATWSLLTLQQALRSGEEALPLLGATTIRRVLQDAGYSYQRTRTWCPTGIAQRVRKTGVALVVDARAEEKKDSSNKPITAGNQ